MDTGFLSFYLYLFLISASAPIGQLSVVDVAAGSEGLWFSFFLHIDISDTVSYQDFLLQTDG